MQPGWVLCHDQLSTDQFWIPHKHGVATCLRALARWTHTTIMSANSPFPMPSASADLATTWAFLEDGVDHIMTKLQTGVSYSKVK